MLTPLLLLWPASLALTWLVAQNIADKPFDRALEYNVQALAQLVVVKNGQAHFNLPQPARELLRADDSDQIYYQVLGLRGELLSGEKEVPAPPENIKSSAWEVKLEGGKTNDAAVVHGDIGDTLGSNLGENFRGRRDKVSFDGAQLVLADVAVTLGGTGVVVKGDAGRDDVDQGKAAVGDGRLQDRDQLFLVAGETAGDKGGADA